MKKAKNKKAPSTFELEMKNSKFKKKFDEEYEHFLLSELLLELMEKEKVSVRNLSKESGVSTSIIQGLRTGDKRNLTINSLTHLLHALGWKLVAKKGRKEYTLA